MSNRTATPGELATLTTAEVDKLIADYDEIQHDEAEVRKKRDKFGKYVKGLMTKGATRRDISRALNCTDQTVSNLAGDRRSKA